MSEVVDCWVERLKDKIKPIGEMTHWERLAAAFDLKRTDLVPVAPELDYWQITYAGYSHQEIYNDVDKTTDACIKTWADLRTDAIWMYVDISHQIENFVPPEKRPNYFIHRGEKDYLHVQADRPQHRRGDRAVRRQGLGEVHGRLAGSEPLSPAHAPASRVPGEDGPRGAGDHRGRHANELRRDHRGSAAVRTLDDHRAQEGEALPGSGASGAAGRPGLLRRIRRWRTAASSSACSAARAPGGRSNWNSSAMSISSLWRRRRRSSRMSSGTSAATTCPRPCRRSRFGRAPGRAVRHAVLRPETQLPGLVRACSPAVRGQALRHELSHHAVGLSWHLGGGQDRWCGTSSKRRLRTPPPS